MVKSCYNLAHTEAEMTVALLARNFLLMILMPILLGRWIAVRRRVGWGFLALAQWRLSCPR